MPEILVKLSRHMGPALPAERPAQDEEPLGHPPVYASERAKITSADERFGAFLAATRAAMNEQMDHGSTISSTQLDQILQTVGGWVDYFSPTGSLMRTLRSGPITPSLMLTEFAALVEELHRRAQAWDSYFQRMRQEEVAFEQHPPRLPDSYHETIRQAQQDTLQSLQDSNDRIYAVMHGLVRQPYCGAGHSPGLCPAGGGSCSLAPSHTAAHHCVQCGNEFL
jgi:hypothetical protein